MANSLETLERHRAEILRQMQQLGDMRRGSVVEQYLRCGKSPCCCKRPGHLGHGPYFALTCKVAGKTKTRQLRAGPVLEKVRREVQAFHRFRELSERLIQINEEICEHRRVEEQGVKKTSWPRSVRRSNRKSKAS
jgi:hypothetical protein